MLELTPKQKIWVRVAIYVPLIAYFGYGAYKAYRVRNAPPPPAAEPKLVAPELEGVKREYVLPNGQTVTVTEMTEEQARAQGFNLPDEDEPTPAETTSTDTGANTSTGGEPPTEE